jgi:uncharacterized protein
VSLAAQLKLPALKLPDLSALRASLSKLSAKRGAVLLLWVAFLAGLVGADVWFTSRKTPLSPVAALEIGPMPAPLVAGRDPIDRPLASAPRADLVISTPEGNLPTVAAKGDQPRVVYAYPFDRADARPRISIVLNDVGLQPNLLSEAVARLPGSVALAFSAFTPELDKAVQNARAAGHEVLLTVPAASPNPADDAGPGALRPELSVAENMQRLRSLMARASGYVGVLFPLKTPVTGDDNLMQALFTESRVRGLQLITDQPDFVAIALTEQAAAAVVSFAVDDVLDPAAINQALMDIEQRARETGHVVVTSALYPFLINALTDWLPTLSGKGIALAPVSAASQLPSTESIKQPASAAPEAATSHDKAPAHSAPAPQPH